MAEENHQKSRIPWKFVISIQIIALVTIAIAVMFSYSGIYPFNNPLGIYRLLPGDILIDFIWIYVFSLIVGFIVYLILPSLASFFIRIHRVLTGGNYDYHIQVLGNRNEVIGYGRFMIPAFISLGLSTSLSTITSFVDLVFVTESFDSLSPTNQILEVSMPIFFILLLIASLILLLLAPAWILEDVGLICERRVEDQRMTVDIEGVGNWYLTLLKGFAGLSSLTAYFFITLETLEWYQHLPGQIEVSILFYIIPVIVTFLAPLYALAPITAVYVFYELSLRKNIKEIENRLENDGIRTVTIDMFTSKRA